MTDVVQRLWGFCHTLRHEGVDYGDYIEQITYLLFLKMAEEREVELPQGCEWEGLRAGQRYRPHGPLHRGPSDAREAAGSTRRHLLGGAVPLQ